MLRGKTALITGANGGIGKSIVNLFLKNNANVICLIRRLICIRSCCPI